MQFPKRKTVGRQQLIVSFFLSFVRLLVEASPTNNGNSTVTIGVLLTNVGSTVSGRAEALGALLAANAVNSDPTILPNKKVKVEIYDDEMTPWTALRSSCSLARHGVHAIIGPTFSSVASHLSLGFCSAFGVPCISHSATSPDLSGSPFFGRVVPSDAYMARGIVEVASDLAWNRLCVLHEDSQYGIGGAAEMVRASKRRGIEIIATHGYPADLAYEDVARAKPAVVAARDAGCRIFVLYCLVGGCSAVLGAAREAGLVDGRNFGWILSDGCASAMADETFFDSTSPGMQRDLLGTLCVVPSHRRRGVGYDQFIDAYLDAVAGRQEFGRPAFGDENAVDPYALYAHDAVIAAARAIHAVPEAVDEPFQLAGDDSQCVKSIDGIGVSTADSLANVAASQYTLQGGGVRPWPHGEKVMRALTDVRFVCATCGDDEFNLTDTYEPASAHYSVHQVQEYGVRSSLFFPVGNITVSAQESSPAKLWMPPCGLQWSQDSKGNCDGAPSDSVKRNLRILTCIEAPPFVIFAKSPACTEKCREEGHCPNECYTGVAFEILKEVQQNLNSTAPFEYEVFHQLCRGHDSLIREVMVNGDYDMFVADATATAFRAGMGDISAAYFHTGLQLMRVTPASTKEGGVGFTRILRPFALGVWIALSLYFLTYCAAFWLVERGVNPDIPDERDDAKPGGVWMSTYWGASSMAQNSQVSASTSPGQLLFVGFTLCNLLIVTVYTANLAVQLILSRAKPTVVGLADIGTTAVPFQSVCLQNRGGSIEGFFNQSFLKNKNYRPCYNCEIPFDEWNLTRALSELRNGNCKYIMGDADTLLLQALTDNECSLEMTGDRFYEQEYSFMLKKNDPFTAVVSTEIRRLREELVIDKLKDEFWNGKCDQDTEDDDETEYQLGLQEMAVVFIVASIFLVLSIALAGRRPWANLRWPWKLFMSAKSQDNAATSSKISDSNDVETGRLSDEGDESTEFSDCMTTKSLYSWGPADENSLETPEG